MFHNRWRSWGTIRNRRVWHFCRTCTNYVNHPFSWRSWFFISGNIDIVWTIIHLARIWDAETMISPSPRDIYCFRFFHPFSSTLWKWRKLLNYVHYSRFIWFSWNRRYCRCVDSITREQEIHEIEIQRNEGFSNISYYFCEQNSQNEYSLLMRFIEYVYQNKKK